MAPEFRGGSDSEIRRECLELIQYSETRKKSYLSMELLLNLAWEFLLHQARNESTFIKEN